MNMWSHISHFMLIMCNCDTLYTNVHICVNNVSKCVNNRICTAYSEYCGAIFNYLRIMCYIIHISSLNMNNEHKVHYLTYLI